MTMVVFKSKQLTACLVLFGNYMKWFGVDFFNSKLPHPSFSFCAYFCAGKSLLERRTGYILLIFLHFFLPEKMHIFIIESNGNTYP